MKSVSSKLERQSFSTRMRVRSKRIDTSSLAAGIYLLWERWRRLKEKEEKAVLSDQKNHLDELLTSTVEIEARQIGVTDTEELREMLNEVTRIKLQALDELIHQR